jgi:DNA gyrase subunit A
MVTLASPWSNNVPLIDGHGNWGSSVDGAAASRYTECKLSPFSWECLLDDADTWVTTDNYDGSLQEPIELNAKIPTVLLNGQDGIGVGFATKIPPHSLRDICDAITKGTPLTPSFPTQCHVVRDEGLDSYVRTGIGSLRLRAKCEVAIEEKNGRKKEKTTVTFTNLPHGTNPEKVGEQIASALEKGTLNGITAVIDESDLSGDRISVTAKSGTDIALLTRQLYHYTDLDTKYSARLLVVDGTKPVELSPSELLARWCNWRMDRLGTKFRHELDASETRLEIVRGYLKAIDKIDTVIAIIRKAASPKEALIELVSNKALKFTGDQARAILEMRLRALTNLDSEELRTEERSLCVRIEELDELVKNEKTRKAYMLKEIKAIGVRHGDANRSELIDPPEGLTVEKGSQNRTAPVSRPKFIKIDTKRGVAEQVKGPRGAIVMEKTDKLVTVTQDGTIKKLPANYKGPLSTGFSPVVLAKKESDVTSRKYLVVFTLEEALKAMVVSGEDLTKVTSKGKSLLPEGATLIHFGEGAYDVPWVSARKKPLKLDLSTKAGRPGAKGIKVAALTEIQL